MEKTLVLIKPDAFEKRIVGQIISRIERIGLNLDDLKMIKPDRETVEKHYPDEHNWVRKIGERTIDSYRKYNLDLRKDFNDENSLQIGKTIREWLIQYIISGPVIAIIVSGNHAVEVVRKIIGNTAPIFADLGTIRGDFSIDSPDLADKNHRAIHNLIHASGSIEEAEKEISLWF